MKNVNIIQKETPSNKHMCCLIVARIKTNDVKCTNFQVTSNFPSFI